MPRITGSSLLPVMPVLMFCQSGPRFNIKMLSYQYRKYHCGDKTVVRSSYLHNRISCTGKITSLYWIRAQTFRNIFQWYLYKRYKIFLLRIFFFKCQPFSWECDFSWCHGVSNHQQLNYLFNSLTTMKTSNICFTGPLGGKSNGFHHRGPVMRTEFPCHDIIMWSILNVWTQP